MSYLENKDYMYLKDAFTKQTNHHSNVLLAKWTTHKYANEKNIISINKI